MIAYGKVPIANTGKRFITHQDKEVDGCSFMSCAADNTFYYIIAKGLGAKLSAWATRVGATQLTEAEFRAAVGPLVPLNATCSMGYTHPSTARQELLYRITAFIA